MCGNEAMPTAEDYKERGNKFTGKVRKGDGRVDVVTV
jgi:hypothetical protein